MRNELNLLVAITSHGYGHVAQIAPIVNMLRKKWPIRLTISCNLPDDFLRTHIEGPFKTVAGVADFGMVMSSSIDIKREESAKVYQQIHGDWEKQVDLEAKRLKVHSPDIILANIPYITLAAANKLNIPAVGIGSLNWADIFSHYCHSMMDASKIVEQMRMAYNYATVFLQVEPCMPMEWILKRERIGVVARIGQNKRKKINAALSLSGNEQLIVLGFGGMATRLPVETWPLHTNLRWIVPKGWHIKHPNAIDFESLGVSFIDLIRSCDVLITKPGYGAFTEAVSNNVPVIYVARRDWPEEPYLVSWLKKHTRAIEIERIQLENGDLIPHLKSLQTMSLLHPPTLNGVMRAVNWIEKNLLSK